MLGTFTDEGIRDIRNLRQRVAENRRRGEQRGLYLTMVQDDFVVLVEGPDDVTTAAQALGVGSRGGNRTQTPRAFTLDEADAIFRKLGGARRARRGIHPPAPRAPARQGRAATGRGKSRNLCEGRVGSSPADHGNARRPGRSRGGMGSGPARPQRGRRWSRAACPGRPATLDGAGYPIHARSR